MTGGAEGRSGWRIRIVTSVTARASSTDPGVIRHPVTGAAVVGIVAERLRLLQREIFTAAGGDHGDF